MPRMGRRLPLEGEPCGCTGRTLAVEVCDVCGGSERLIVNMNSAHEVLARICTPCWAARTRHLRKWTRPGGRKAVAS